MAEEANSSVFQFLGYRLDAWQRRLQGPDGDPVTLRPKEFDVLLELVRRAGNPVAKDELMSLVWPDAVVEENNLNQVISRLRQIFGDDHSDPRFIATITGRGYQFVAKVESPEPIDHGEATPPDAPRGIPPWGLAAAAIFLIAGTAAVVNLLRGYDGTESEAPAGLGDAVLVTDSPAANSMPTLSPDGTLMAFVSDRSGTSQIWIKGLPDGSAVQLTTGPQPADSPSWSPVSDGILFQRAGPDGVQSVWLVSALGDRPPRLVVRDAAYPRFAPDGQSFVFRRGLREIHIGYLDGDRTRRLDGMPETPGFAEVMPAINADGDIAFVLADEGPSGNLWLYEAATSEFRQLTQSDGDFAGVFAASPVWLPDNRTIIYTASPDEPMNTHLWSVDTETAETFRLSTGVGGYAEPAVSGDGSRLVYVYAQPIWRLVRTDPATGAHRIIHETRKPVVLPVISGDGKTLSYFGENVFTLPVDGGQPVQRTFGEPGQATLPAWSRSASEIFYYRGRELHRIDTDTGIDELALSDFHWSRQNWLAVHENRLAYRIRSRWPGRARSVIHDLDTGVIQKLDDDILPTDWSRDGKTLLGRRLGDYPLLTCAAETLACEPIMNGELAILGAMPRWSSDESRVFFRRARADKPGFAEIWAVSPEGGSPERLFELGPYQPANFFFAVAHDDSIIWNQFESHGNPEIWMTRDLGASAEEQND